MQLQIGKKRRFLEEAFDARTAELRVLSERKYYSMALPPHQIRQDHRLTRRLTRGDLPMRRGWVHHFCQFGMV
jgi:hypothetical protein